MKKKTIYTSAGLLTICLLAGSIAVTAMTGQAKADENGGAFSSQTYEEAYAGDAKTSAAEKEKAEKERREAIAQEYAVYSEFGLTYDKDKDRFFYNGKMVRCFGDNVSDDSTVAFVREDGVIDLKARRDASGKLLELVVASDEEFAARSARQEKIEAEIKAAGFTDTDGSACFELGDTNAKDDSLDAYAYLGISYDAAAKQYFYNGDPIRFFYDPEGATYYNAVENGLNLKVVRDEDGECRLEKMDEKETVNILK